MVSLFYHTPNQSPEEMPIWYPYIITPQTKALRRCLYGIPMLSNPKPKP